jgi:predicted nucleic acid-binding protein
VTDYYADSSVLVKRHVYEAGANWFQALADPSTGNVIITSRISLAEVYSALNRRRREAGISIGDYVALVSDFDLVCVVEYQIVELTSRVVERARTLLEVYSLRAYDAVQLASAILTNETLQIGELAPLVFLAADSRLLSAAEAEGLSVDNPNIHL